MVRGAEKQTAQWQSGEMAEMGGDREVVSFTERFKQKLEQRRGGKTEEQGCVTTICFVFVKSLGDRIITLFFCRL